MEGLGILIDGHIIINESINQIEIVTGLVEEVVEGGSRVMGVNLWKILH